METRHPAVVLCPPLGSSAAEAGAAAPEARDWRQQAHDALLGAGIAVLAPDLQALPSVQAAATAADARSASGGAAAGGPDRVGDDADARLVLAGWVADLAVAINRSGLREPLLLVAHGSAARGLPALGFAQRAARHQVVGYVLVDAPPPPPSRSGQDWPDAPVTAIQSPGSDSASEHGHAARLRGWSVVVAPPAQVLVSLAQGWPDLPGA